MELEDALALVNEKLGALLSARFTGKATFTFNCREGGLGNVSLQINQDFSKKDLQNPVKSDKLSINGSR